MRLQAEVPFGPGGPQQETGQAKHPNEEIGAPFIKEADELCPECLTRAVERRLCRHAELQPQEVLHSHGNQDAKHRQGHGPDHPQLAPHLTDGGRQLLVLPRVLLDGVSQSGGQLLVLPRVLLHKVQEVFGNVLLLRRHSRSPS